MPRKKKVPVFAPPAWRQTLKAKSLSTALGNCHEAGNLLAKEARNGTISAHEWAERFNVADTWIEKWAENQLAGWQLEPHTFPNLFPPSDEGTKADSFSFSITDARPFCKFSLGVLTAGSLPAGAEEDDWERFKKGLHFDLDLALNRYRDSALQSGASKEVKVPSDLEKKLGVAGLYFFRGMSPDEIGDLRQVARDRTVVYRWLDEIVGLLGLRMRDPGAKPKYTYLLP